MTNLTLHTYLKVLGVVVVGLIVITLAGFGAKAAYHEITKERPHFNTGTIIQKDFDPAHYDDYTTQQYMGQTCYGSGTTQTCTDNYMTVYHHDYVPDSWSVRIQNCNVYHKNGSLWVDKRGNAKCFHKWIDVDQSYYRQSHIGGRYA